jgi:hypothetical protein
MVTLHQSESPTKISRSKRSRKTDPPHARETAAYIADMMASLSTIAGAPGLETLQPLLKAVQREATSIYRRRLIAEQTADKLG